MSVPTGAEKLLARIHDDDKPALVCGVLNVTPDSFSDGGRFTTVSAALQHALTMADEGADLIDIGGESTRPGAVRPTEHEELERVLPIIEAITARVSTPVSVDSSRAAVMAGAVEAGAVLFNDVRGLEEAGALELAAQEGVLVCVSHMQGQPASMQREPAYCDVVAEVRGYLNDRLEACVAAGIVREKVVIDPGFGFGKLLSHNLALLSSLREFADVAPVMAGLSRKSLIGALTGRGLHERLAGSLAGATVAAFLGARILRVHDVAATKDALAVTDAARRASALRPHE